MADIPLDQYQEQTPFGLYSHAAETAAALPQAKGSPDQFKAMLMKQGVKPAEIEHSGYDDVFAGRPSVTKDELVQHFRQNMPSINEALLSKAPKYANYAVAPSRYHTYTLPGAENYREVLLKTRSESGEHEANATKALEAKQEASRRYDRAEPGSPEAKAALQDLRAAELLYRQHLDKYLKTKDDVYQHGHWPGQKNVLAHLRMADRWGPNNEKILHIEELQSDWGQEARESGMRDPRNPTEDDDTMVPHHPYVKHTGAWTDLALKKVLHEAAHGGYDKVIFTPGEEQVARFDLSNHLSRIIATPTNEGKIHLHLYDHQDTENPFEAIMGLAPEELPKHVGKELSERIMKEVKFPEDQKVWQIRSKVSNFKTGTTPDFDRIQEVFEQYPENVRSKLEIVPVMQKGGAQEADLRGLDLKVGGEGMKGFYDKILPEQLNALVKKHDPQVRMRRDSIETWKGTHPVHALDITPKLRESILRGQKAFAAGGEVDDDGITAYHGSPHDFERFDLSKIGTGEGAQAFGHGLYFAGAEPVAQTYRGDPEERYRRFSGHMDPKEEYAFDLASQAGDVRDFDVMMGLAKKYGENIDFEEAQRLAEKAVSKRGHMYEVHINAHPDHFLDWDKPLRDQKHFLAPILEKFGGEQSVRDAYAKWDKLNNDLVVDGQVIDRAADNPLWQEYDRLSSLGADRAKIRLGRILQALDTEQFYPDKYKPQSKLTQKGEDLWHAVSQMHKNNDVASNVFRESGIPGIKYFDAGSRGAGEGSRNYVVFDDKLVGIKRKYARGGVVTE